MPIKKTDVVLDILNSAKNFFTDLLKLEPNMTLDKIAEVTSPRLDDLILKYEEHGLKYGAGKFSIRYIDSEHFRLEFEMYFQDDAGKWHKCANESDNRNKEILEEGAWKTIETLKVITFPIEEPQAADAPFEESPPVRTKTHFADKETPSVHELIDFLDSARTWQEFETCFKEFLIEMPNALIREGITDHAAKIFSIVSNETLCVSYKLYYKEGGSWVEKTISRNFDEMQAPTWATKELSATEKDVTARYEKNFRISI